jgi:hypothetical protein
VVLDVERFMQLENTGTSFRALAYTSRHCDVLNESKLLSNTGGSSYWTDTVGLKVFAFGSYHDLDVTSLSPPGLNMSSQGDGKLRAAYDVDFSRFSALESDRCLGQNGRNTVCATMGDLVAFRVLLGKAWGTGLSADLVGVFRDAYETRERIRSEAKRSAAGPARAAAEVAEALGGMWTLRRDLRFGAPHVVDMSLVCLEPALKQRYEASDGQQTPGPTALDSPLVGETSPARAWREGILEAWRTLGPKAVLEQCSKLQDRQSELDFVSEDLERAGLLDNGRVKAGALPLAYAAALIERHRKLSETLSNAWADLGPWLASENGKQNFWVAANLERRSAGSTALTAGQPGEPSASGFVTFSLGQAVLPVAKAEVLGSGLQFVSRPEDHVVFGQGDSGSLFTFRGQFPLLALYAVDGNEVSGGVAVLPLPESTSGAQRAGDPPDVLSPGALESAGGADETTPILDASGGVPATAPSGSPSGSPNGTAVSMQGGEPAQAALSGYGCN